MKVKCQAYCSKCYHEKGRTQEYDPNDLIWFCSSCKKNFLCEIGVTQGFQVGTTVYSCTICSRPLIKEEVDKSIITKKSVPSQQKKTRDLYQKLLVSENKFKTRKWWQKSNTQIIPLPRLEQSQISELCDIDGLTVPLLIEFAHEFHIKNFKAYDKIKTVQELLSRLAKEDQTITSTLYSALVQRDSIPFAFKLRFAVFCNSQFKEKRRIILPHNSIDYEGYDMKLVEPSMKETWIFCLKEDIDIDNLERLAKRVFNVDFKNFPKLKEIFLVAKSFSYLAKGLLAKYQSVFTGVDTPPDESTTGLWRSIPLSLWQPKHCKNDFENVSLK
ncbi:MAG: hypothetical protein ACFFCU_13160 [Promethearchaeota archaeon]